MTRYGYIKNNWKLGIHLLFHTYHFGVNNQWWVPWRSIFGLPLYKRWRILRHYKEIKFRCGIGFINRTEYEVIFKDKQRQAKWEKKLINRLISIWPEGTPKYNELDNSYDPPQFTKLRQFIWRNGAVKGRKVMKLLK